MDWLGLCTCIVLFQLQTDKFDRHKSMLWNILGVCADPEGDRGPDLLENSIDYYV